jgi:hypothetical protein
VRPAVGFDHAEIGEHQGCRLGLHPLPGSDLPANHERGAPRSACRVSRSGGTACFVMASLKSALN